MRATQLKMRSASLKRVSCVEKKQDATLLSHVADAALALGKTRCDDLPFFQKVKRPYSRYAHDSLGVH